MGCSAPTQLDTGTVQGSVLSHLLFDLLPKSVTTGAMYGTRTTRRQEGAKADAAKRKRAAGPDILNPQIRALEALDEALDTDHNVNHNIKSQEA